MENFIISSTNENIDSLCLKIYRNRTTAVSFISVITQFDSNPNSHLSFPVTTGRAGSDSLAVRLPVDKAAGRTHAWHSVFHGRITILPTGWKTSSEIGTRRVPHYRHIHIRCQVYFLQVRMRLKLNIVTYSQMQIIKLNITT